jgi:hypothetical protein
MTTLLRPERCNRELLARFKVDTSASELGIAAVPLRSGIGVSEALSYRVANAPADSLVQDQAYRLRALCHRVVMVNL